MDNWFTIEQIDRDTFSIMSGFGTKSAERAFSMQTGLH